MTNTDVVGKLQTLISEGDEVDRCYAIQSLVTMKHTGANDLLVNCLRDDDIDVCVDAANALAELGDHSTSEKLIESLLNDPDGEVKTACIKALANLGEREAIPHLLKIISERPEDIAFDTNEWDYWWDMQLECIKAMGKMRVSEAVPALQGVLESEDYLDIEDEIFRSLAQMGPEGEALLLKLIESGNSRTRRRVVKALGRCQSNESLKSLARALRDETPEVREASLNSLSSRRQAIHYLPIILHLFHDQSASVRSSAIKVAQQLSQQINSDETTDFSQLLEKVLPLLSDTDQRVKTTVLNVLARLDWTPDKNTSETVVQLLGQSKEDCFGAVCEFIQQHQITTAVDDIVLLYKRNTLGVEEKRHVISALGQLRRWDRNIELLMGLSIYDDKKSVRVAALEALACLDEHFPAEPNPEESENRSPFDMIVEALLGRLAPPASKRVIPVSAGDPQNPVSNENGSEVKAQQPSNSSFEVKKGQLKMDESDAFVSQAMDEISRSINSGEKPVPLSTLDSMAISSVENKLEEQEKRNADQVDNPQGILGDDPDEKPGLSVEDEQELKEFLEITRANAETAKWLFNKEVVTVELDIQRLAARLMGTIGSSRVIPALLKVVNQEDSNLKAEAILSIGKLAKADSLPDELASELHCVLLQALNESNRDLRIAAIRVLGELGDERNINILVPLLEDKEVAVRTHAIHALSQLAQRGEEIDTELKALLGALLNQLNGSETGVHRAAVDAMIPLFSLLDCETDSIKQSAIDRLIESGLAGSDGQVKDMTRGLSALDKEQSSACLLVKLDKLESSVERRYIVEMLGELHRPTLLH